MRRTLLSAATLLALAVLAAAGLRPGAAPAQDVPAVKRTLLQRVAYPGDHDTVLGTAELPPGTSIGRHVHPGIEIGYVLEGEAVLSVEGEPDRVIRPGDSYQVAPGRPHDARATGDRPAKVLAVWAVERGKPLATPHPH